MIVDVPFIGMGCHNERLLPFRKAHGQLVSQPVGFFRRDLAGLEGLPHVISDHVIPAKPTPRMDGVSAPVQREFLCGGAWVALITGNELFILCFLRVFHIPDGVPQGFDN